MLIELKRLVAATRDECESKLAKARVEMDNLREQLRFTQRQWADYTRIAEKEKARLREVAATALNDQRIADSYEAQARVVAIAACK